MIASLSMQVLSGAAKPVDRIRELPRCEPIEAARQRRASSPAALTDLGARAKEALANALR